MAIPAWTSTVTLSRRGVRRNSSPFGHSQFSPVAPASPPARPQGVLVRRSVTSETVAGSSSWITRSMPSPPGPKPPPASPAQAVSEHPHGVGPLQRLGGGVLGVRHPGVDAVHAGETRAAPLAAADRLEAIPDRIPAASQRTMNNLIIGGPTFAYYVYELGRNFWFWSPQLQFHSPEHDVAVTGFAVWMRFRSMAAAGVRGAPFTEPPSTPSGRSTRASSVNTRLIRP